LIHPVVGVGLLSQLTGADLSGYPVDGPVPELPETNGMKSRQRLLLDLARRDNLTIRQTYLRVAGARGHLQVVGTPASIADQLQQWFEQGGADGFNIMSPVLPGGLQDFIELVLPELRRRGLFRHDYQGSTLREHLGWCGRLISAAGRPDCRQRIRRQSQRPLGGDAVDDSGAFSSRPTGLVKEQNVHNNPGTDPRQILAPSIVCSTRNSSPVATTISAASTAIRVLPD